MFTGIVEEKGTVVDITESGDAIELTISASRVLSDSALGDSIAVNGVCLTVAQRTEDTFTADVMQESLDRTSLGSLEPGMKVNLERAMGVSDRFGGHIVQGHVDGTAKILERKPSEHWEVVRFSLPENLNRYVVEKGSITVDGTSLTVSAISDALWFEVSLIPTTLAETTLGEREVGDIVNLEVDILAKYVAKMMGQNSNQVSSYK